VATIGDIKAGLSNADQEAKKALTQLSSVTAQVDKAIAVLQALMAGTSQPAVLAAIGKLNAAKQKFTEGGASIRGALVDTERYNSVL
jgi:alpha-D-ribose 1-methylphosphonate 5-triphosphate synthase subunit PhnH